MKQTAGHTRQDTARHLQYTEEMRAMGIRDKPIAPALPWQNGFEDGGGVGKPRRNPRREHIIALEPMDKGLMGTLLRYPYEVRDPKEYFDDIQDVKVTKDMLDLARHIVNQKAGHFEPDKFEDQYETALIDLINQKRAGKPITAKERPRGENVVDLMDALRKSIGAAGPAKDSKPAKKRKVASGQKEMLMPIAGKKPPKEAAAKKPAARSHRKSA